jgi:hypothetical protein
MITPVPNGTEPISMQMFADAITHSGVQVWLIISGVINIVLMVLILTVVWCCFRHKHRVYEPVEDDSRYPGASIFSVASNDTETTLNVNSFTERIKK